MIRPLICAYVQAKRIPWLGAYTRNSVTKHMGVRRPPYKRSIQGGPNVNVRSACGLLLVRLGGGVGLLVFRQLLLDLGVALQVIRVGLDLLGLHDLLEALADVVVARRLKVAGLDQLDHVPAVLRLNGLLGVLAGLQAPGRHPRTA